MLQMTMRQALKNPLDAPEHCLYLYRDGEVIFYVGRSVDPILRLREHLGIGGRNLPSSFGDLIRDNLLASLEWIMEMFTLTDCESVTHDSHLSLELAEMALIAHYKPCLNRTHHTYQSPLPKRYIKVEIANSGVKLS